MTLTESFALASFALFSFADLRYRLVPGIELFLLGTVLLTLPATPIQTGIILLAVFGEYSVTFQAGLLCRFCFIHPPGPCFSQDMVIDVDSLAGLIYLLSVGYPVSSLYLLCFFPC